MATRGPAVTAIRRFTTPRSRVRAPDVLAAPELPVAWLDLAMKAQFGEMPTVPVHGSTARRTAVKLRRDSCFQVVVRQNFARTPQRPRPAPCLKPQHRQNPRLSLCFFSLSFCECDGALAAFSPGHLRPGSTGQRIYGRAGLSWPARIRAARTEERSPYAGGGSRYGGADPISVEVGVDARPPPCSSGRVV